MIGTKCSNCYVSEAIFLGWCCEPTVIAPLFCSINMCVPLLFLAYLLVSSFLNLTPSLWQGFILIKILLCYLYDLLGLILFGSPLCPWDAHPEWWNQEFGRQPPSIADSVHSLFISESINYWVDTDKINEIYPYKTEEYSADSVNKFDMDPDQIPSWLVDWIPEEGGYLIGDLQASRMDFRFFSLGNLWSSISSLGNLKQNEGIPNLI